VVLRVGSAAGTPGQVVSFSVTLGAAGQDVAGTLNDIVFDPSTPIAVTAFGKPDCTVNSSLGKDVSGFSFLPSGCTPGVDCTSARALVAGFNVNPFGSIPDGAVLYTCNVQISATAMAGSTLLACPPGSSFYTDPNKVDFPADCANGSITVQ